MNNFTNDHKLPEYTGPFRDVIPKYLMFREAQGLKYSHRLAQQLRRMDNFFHDLGIEEPYITREAYEAYTKRNPSEKKSTVEIRRSSIRPFARYLESLGYENIYTGYDDHRPFKSSYIPYIYSKEEILHMFSILNDEHTSQPTYLTDAFRIAMLMYYCCGFRRNEVIYLRFADVDLSSGKITIREGKNNISRIVIASDSLLEELNAFARAWIPDNTDKNDYFLYPERTRKAAEHCIYNGLNSLFSNAGKKYHDSKAAYRRMREVSDRLCREHGLSVIEHPEGKGGSYYLNQLERAGMPTRYNVARQAIDEAISRSVNMEEFRHELKMMGYRYQFSPSRRYWTITPAGWDRPIRLYRLGAEYTEERIQQRIYENDISVRERRLARAAYRPNQYSLRRRVDRIMGRSGLEKLYLRYCYELGYLPKYNQKPAKLHPLLREDLLKCEMYSQQARLLCRNGIETEADLLLHMERIRKRSEEIMRRRQQLRNQVKRKTTPEEEKVQAKAEIAELSGQLKNLRREAKLCENIRQRSHQMDERLTAVDREREERKKVRER